jgi:hypothetical protein
MEDPPPAPDGFTYEMDLVDGEPAWILVPVVLQGVATKEAGNAGGGGGSGTSGSKRGRRGAATYPGAGSAAGKRRARMSKKKEEDEADQASSSEFEPEPDPEQSRSTKKRKRKMTTVLPTVVGSATEEACGAALGVWAGSCVPKVLWGVLRKFAKPPTTA